MNNYICHIPSLSVYVEPFLLIVCCVDAVQNPFLTLDFLRLAGVLLSLNIPVTVSRVGGLNLNTMILVRQWIPCLIDVFLTAPHN
jgi:hypothetical protein